MQVIVFFPAHKIPSSPPSLLHVQLDSARSNYETHLSHLPPRAMRETRAREREIRAKAEREVRQAEEREHERVVAAELEAHAALARERTARQKEQAARDQLMLMGRH